MNTWAGQLAARVGSRVRERRGELGLSAEQLSALTNGPDHRVTRSTIANLENGRRPTVTVPELLAIARALDTQPWLLCPDLGPAILTNEVGALRSQVDSLQPIVQELHRLARVCDRQTEEILRLKAQARSDGTR